MTLNQLIENNYQKENNLNCAETILWGGNQAYELGLSKESLKLAAGFGGGMCTENDCGVVVGMTMVLSHLYANEKGHTSPEMKAKIQDAIVAFKTELGTLNCKALKAEYRTEEKGCHEIIAYGGIILDQIIGLDLKKLPFDTVTMIKK